MEKEKKEKPSGVAMAVSERPLLAPPSSTPPDLSFCFERLRLNDPPFFNNSHQLGPTPSLPSPVSCSDTKIKKEILGFVENVRMYSGYGSGNQSTSHESLVHGGDRVVGILECMKECNLLLMALGHYGQEDGYKYLLHLLTNKDPKMVAKILDGVVDFVFEVMTNKYGHHLFVKLIESCNVSQLTLIIARVTREKDRFVHAAFTQHGSSSIKRLIGLLRKSPLVSSVVSSLSCEFYSMMSDQKAKSVIIACLDLLNNSQNEMLYLLAKKYCIALATDQERCPSLNDFISSSRGEGRRELVGAITEHSLYLSKDALGNYVVQHILDLGDPFFIAKICSILRGHYVELSLQKSGSHVVEKCLKTIGMRYPVSDLLDCGSSMLVKVARNQFGNYVIQTALRATRIADFQLHGELLMAIHENLDKLQCVYGRNVLTLVNKLRDGF